MERTEKNLPFDNTPKPLKRQDFSESRFQNAPSFSSQGRYNHFDTAAYPVEPYGVPTSIRYPIPAKMSIPRLASSYRSTWWPAHLPL